MVGKGCKTKHACIGMDERVFLLEKTSMN